MTLRYTIVYIILIVAVNYGFTVVPLIEMPGGEKWPPLSLIVGFIFVARDFAQRESGYTRFMSTSGGQARPLAVHNSC